MKVIDCYWELSNLSEKVVEIIIEKNDVPNLEKLNEIVSKYQYAVVKVPMNMPMFNIGLASSGFFLIETQLNISKRYKDFNFEDKLIRKIYPHIHSEIVNSYEALDDLLSKITPDMYSTDRIYLDPHFDHSKSSQRYINWIRTEFENNKGIVTKTFYDDKNVGFSLYRLNEQGVIHGLLGGVFEEYQDSGLGLMTASAKFIVAHKDNNPFKVIHTTISSNNVPMMQFYNYLHFKVDSMTYVFVKHNK